ncbi:uncharacterized protein BDR25DRAFT_301180 [Lindgomyces ingoldianus]|uniref:Uncharacterized protein n=1 Tax=Lindgomyces ingoldianus TaxID=673940 RepID=A0ACB6RAK2_9PLEO|nr:uncharacterized protein BDR25DRAFT_301180 [Lindgomyces ingoldianus]KAF2475557.1 hypothetical protein BDR25DRAFT_301180 [Lindgomyces ingoldianus]
MPPKRKHPSKFHHQPVSTCPHTILTLHPSPHATTINYKGPTPRQRSSALSTPGSNSDPHLKGLNDYPGIQCFPAPLILPDDDLADDPTYPPQSLTSWMRGKWRNEVTDKRRTLYVISPPRIEEGLGEIGMRIGMESLVEQLTGQAEGKGKKLRDVKEPGAEDVVQYLQAFYHGLPVKLFPQEDAEFTTWNSGSSSNSSQKRPRRRGKCDGSAIALRHKSSLTRIRTRSKNSIHQLNLDDLLDAAIEMVPPDAYAVLMLVSQDLYQSADDEFVCGMAIGGSRVCVVSMARYNPDLDGVMQVEREHAWPASHCLSYVNGCCEDEGGEEVRPVKKQKKARTQVKHIPHNSDTTTCENLPTLHERPLNAAVQTHISLPPISAASSPTSITNLWLSRVCRTASHELGHCFGFDHCVYYACNMNASASIREDPRQAPYLCPVDLEKVRRVTGTGVDKWYESMVEYCEAEDRGDVHMFRALGGWCRAMMEVRKGDGGRSSSGVSGGGGGGKHDPITID